MAKRQRVAIREVELEAMKAQPSPSLARPRRQSQYLNSLGYTQVNASNLSISPASGSALTIGTTSTIAATSTTKTISEILLYQTVTDPADIPLLYVTQSPFNVSFTPTRLGSANFTTFAVFTDNTFTALPLSYVLQPSGIPAYLSIQGPVANLPIGLTTVVPVQVGFSNGVVNVTNVATYTTGSGGAKVFSVATGGAITAIGNGVDMLNVSYDGVSASALISVGSCSYALSPVNQTADYGGGSVSIQVTTQDGCAWIAASDSSWLTLTQGTGSGSGTIGAMATPNTAGSAQTAFVTIGNVDVAVIQPATACTYAVTPSSLSLPAAGGSGTVAVATTCPTPSSSDEPWAVVTTLYPGSVEYSVDANTSLQSRSATLTIGTLQMSLTEAGASAPTLGLNPSSLSFGNQVTGTSSPAMTSTLSNAGTAALTISSLSITGPDAAEFTITNLCGSGVAASANCTLSVVFAPTYAGAASASITINDNASGSPQAIALTGIGVLPTNPVITWAPPSAITYGTALSGVQLNAAASVPGQFVYSPAAGALLAAGTDTLSVTFTPTDTLHYSTTTTTVQIMVAKAVPTIAWLAPAPISYGTALSVAQLNASSAVAGTFAYTPATGTILAAGSQTLSVTLTPTDTSDYNISTQTVTLSISKAAPTIAWATPTAITYGTALSATQLNASSPVAGTFAYSPALGTILAGGIHALSLTFTPTDASDNSTVTDNVQLTVNKATPALTVTPSSSSITTAQSLSVTIEVNVGSGSGMPTGSVMLTSGGYSSTATTLSSGGATINITAGSLTAGGDTLTVNYSPDAAGSSNYNSSTGSNTVTVTTAVNPSFSVSGTAVSVAPGASTGNTSTITVTQAGGFTGTVVLTALITSSPSGAQYPPTLGFGTTSSVSVNGTTSGVATLTISTTAAKSAALTYPKHPGAPWYAVSGTALACILLFGFPARRRRWRSILGMLALFVTLASGVLACSGGGIAGVGGTSNPGTTAGTYTITVTGTSGTSATTGAVTLTVQ
jgi:hypothetical protein